MAEQAHTYIVRLDFSNGLHLEFNFNSLAMAEECRKVTLKARLNGELCTLYDEAGRSAEVDTSKLQALQMVDIELETYSIVRLGLLINSVRAQFGLVDPAGANGARGGAPMIGGPAPPADFAS